jgi:hypothetical protein
VEELSESLHMDETAPRRARELLEPVRDAIDIRSFDAIRQVVAELVGQCVRDARPESGRVGVCLRRPADDVVEVEVSRPLVGLLDTPSGAPDSVARMAFQVVDRLVDDWGVRDDAETVTVWFRIHVAALTPRHPR